MAFPTESQTVPEPLMQGSAVPSAPTSAGVPPVLAVSLPTPSDAPSEAADNVQTTEPEPEPTSSSPPLSTTIASSTPGSAEKTFKMGRRLSERVANLISPKREKEVKQPEQETKKAHRPLHRRLQ
ncbi:hypothetical protein CALCODRAFT_495648 [Calocera cornea HHB12733]|uniref:Uncharacterized protein n=1 Tax=Calocera cornea HHB12733 TaxID=1353952 RepID=A0A165GAM6_9BASI|nr:hypothetical protein CALCODRAFT_495648 [Calocera cornea HHB12733]